jgi:hypothetical protein
MVRWPVLKNRPRAVLAFSESRRAFLEARIALTGVTRRFRLRHLRAIRSVFEKGPEAAGIAAAGGAFAFSGAGVGANLRGAKRSRTMPYEAGLKIAMHGARFVCWDRTCTYQTRRMGELGASVLRKRLAAKLSRTLGHSNFELNSAVRRAKCGLDDRGW